MIYADGSAVTLGDIVALPVPEGSDKARVVMLGDTYEHLDTDPQFLSWVKAEKSSNVRPLSSSGWFATRLLTAIPRMLLWATTCSRL